MYIYGNCVSQKVQRNLREPFKELNLENIHLGKSLYQHNYVQKILFSI